MRSVLFKGLGLAVMLLVSACGQESINRYIDEDPTNGSEQKFQQSKTASSDNSIHSLGGWANTVEIYVATNASEQVVEATIAAANSWNQAIGRILIDYKGRLAPQSQAANSLYSTLDDVITFVYYDSDWQAHTAKPATTLATTVWENDPKQPDVIVRGDIVLNAQFYVYQDSKKTSTAPGRDDDVVDSESVILHEMGHLLGLDHISLDEDSGSVMHAKTHVGLGIYSRVLSQGDAARIGKIYNK